MKRPKYPYRIAIIMLLLTVVPIGATQLGMVFVWKTSWL
jgi:hypothetical protein